MSEHVGIRKLPTCIEGFDTISEGGLPRGRVTLVTGTAGSGKTIFTSQFLAEGIESGESTGVFVTLEDTPEDIRKNLQAFGWDIARWEEEGKWVFVDAAPRPDDAALVVGDFDLGGLLARMKHAIDRVGAHRLSIDSVNALFGQFDDERTIRRELFRIVYSLKELEVTTLMTAERPDDYGSLSRWNLEEFVTDNVVILRNALDDERRRRTIEILKFRGARHQNGEFPFTIDSRKGIVVVPLSDVELTQASSTVRIASGNDVLDEMLGGGFFRDSVTLVSGATGTGKTLTTMQFLDAGVKAGERVILFAFEESRAQLVRNAAAWGIDMEGMEADDLLRVVNLYPHARSLEDHLVQVKDLIDEFGPNRVAVDSLSALERVGSVRSYREFVINLTASIKTREIAGLFTATATSLSGGGTITEKHISTLTDTILLLRYVETLGELRRGVAVLKMRGSRHDRGIREFTIDGDGMHIHGPFEHISGVLWGQLRIHRPGELAPPGAGNTG